MLSIISLILLLVTYSNASNCPVTARRINSCYDIIVPPSNCTSWYQWNFNSKMDYNDIEPTICAPDYTTGVCKPSTITCTPSCKIYDNVPSSKKVGGPSGAVCNDFSGNTGNNRQTCIDSYMYQDGGDRWCYWRDNSNYCYRGIICHD